MFWVGLVVARSNSLRAEFVLLRAEWILLRLSVWLYLHASHCASASEGVFVAVSNGPSNRNRCGHALSRIASNPAYLLLLSHI